MQPFDVTPSSPQNMANSGPITVRDVSSADLGGAMSGVTATGGVLVKFFYSRVRIGTRNAAENGRYENRLCVAKQPKSDRSTVATCFITEDEARRLFPREFDYFTKNENAPTEGTPLAELPGITQSQIGLLVLSGLRSIEDLAEIDEDQAREIGFEAIRAQKLARAWASNKDESAESIELADVEARYQSEIDTRDKTNKALQDRVREMEIQLSALRNMGGASAAPAPQEAHATAKAVGVENTDFEDFSNMPNPLADGPSEIERPDPLAQSDD